jgi:hypothetical protein
MLSNTRIKNQVFPVSGALMEGIMAGEESVEKLLPEVSLFSFTPPSVDLDFTAAPQKRCWSP